MTTLVNATVVVESFSPLGAFTKVAAVAAKTGSSMPAEVAFLITDGIGQPSRF